MAALAIPIESAQSLVLGWNADPGPDIAGYRVYSGRASGIYTNMTDVGNVTTNSVTGLVPGAAYYFAVTAYNTFGLESGPSGEVSYTVPAGTNAPAITLAAPLNGASYAAPATINLTANVTANSHTITKVQFYNGSTLLGEDTVAPYTLAWSNVTAGSYNLSAKLVYDAGSTLASSMVTVTVSNTLPVVALTSPLNGANYAAPATINLSASVTPNGHAITKVQFYNGATLLGEDTVAPYTLAWSNVPAGSYNLSASLVYDAGSTLASSTATVTVSNSLPVVVLTSPLNGANYAAPATINLSASVTPNGHAITKVQFYNGATLLGEDAATPYTFAWSNVLAGSYALTALAVFDSGGTATSSPANVTVSGLPAPWQTADIGSVGLAGSAAYNAGTATFTINGSGSDIWNTSDKFRFVWQPASGDCDIRARVTGVQATDAWAKAGVMVRETLSANSEFVDMVMTPNNGAAFQYRTSTGGNCGNTQGTGKTTPYWVRVVRVGNTFKGYISSDGTTWVQVGSTRMIVMASNVYIGLCVTAHNNTALNTSTISNVTPVP